MTRKKWYLFIQAFLCILLVVLLSAAAMRIYRTGMARRAENPLEAIYTVENVADELARLAPLILLTAGMAAAGLFLGIRDEKADGPVKDVRAQRNLLLKRLARPGEDVLREEKNRKRICAAGWAAFAACMIPAAVYMLNGSHFPAADLEGMFFSFAAGVLPWVGAGMACLIAAGILEERSILRQIEALKAQLKTSPQDSGNISPKTGRASGAGRWQAVLIAAAAALIVLGILNGSMQDVLIKASAICTECIGMG